MSTIHTLKERIATKGFALNGYCQMPGAFSAELYASQGWDAVTLDLQHGLIGYDSALPMLQAIHGTGVLPMARIPGLDDALIGKLLDAGVLGITCAMINTAAQAEALVRACKYPPRGDRSMGPVRAGQIYGEAYRKDANRLVNVFAMIETMEGMVNLESITEVEGLDGIYVGAGDLAMSFGKPARSGALDPVVEEAVEAILRRCTARGLITGIMAYNSAQAWGFIERGFRFVTLASDARALTGQAKAWIDGLYQLAGPRGRP